MGRTARFLATVAASTLIGCTPAGDPPARTAAPPTGSSRPTSSPPRADDKPFAGQLLVWAPGGFSAAEVRTVARSAGTPTAVGVTTLPVRSGVPGYPEVPVEAIVVDAPAFARATGDLAVATALKAGVVLARTSARLRDATVGDVLRTTDGRALPVSAVVDDVLVGGYEAAVSGRPERAEYLLVPLSRDRADVEQSIAASLPTRRSLRFRVAGERPFLRAGDAVLPQLLVKARFGEFAVRRTADGFVVDPAWVRRFIVTRRVPVLGAVRCHTGVVGDLAATMRDLERAGLGRLVDVAGFRRSGGCHNARPVRGATSVSRHTWGIAIDVNVAANPLGRPPNIDARVVAAFERNGFTWGGRWLRPDGGHFEWVGRSPAQGK